MSDRIVKQHKMISSFSILKNKGMIIARLAGSLQVFWRVIVCAPNVL